MDVSENSGTPKSSILYNMVFHYKPSILGYHYFWKHPNREEMARYCSLELYRHQFLVCSPPRHWCTRLGMRINKKQQFSAWNLSKHIASCYLLLLVLAVRSFCSRSSCSFRFGGPLVLLVLVVHGLNSTARQSNNAFFKSAA